MGDNSARAVQLGMPFSTAQQKLRKMILFKYVQLAGHDVCFKCGEQIASIDELSIEHKLPWQSRDTTLFWDLNNIAFSHLRCNTPERGMRVNHHGKTMYSKYGCRCDECREAKTANQQRWRDNTGVTQG